jgi:polyhydroxyalkanoate synthesis regulator phasin
MPAALQRALLPGDVRDDGFVLNDLGQWVNDPIARAKALSENLSENQKEAIRQKENVVDTVSALRNRVTALENRLAALEDRVGE